ncbi:MAG: class I SAM-dependent methyltransferase, partial [Bacteroidota bacterium]|nr:class I SAM-dependent methyltransferase [Bacteroidota bacterium]
MDKKEHWQTVYNTKSPNEVSWTQKRPNTSLDFIHLFGLDKDAKIIDVGGGDSNLVDFLLDQGYSDITVLDISAKALEKAQSRLGSRANKVNWVVSDITEFQPSANYDLWHDRAAFHFLTDPEQIKTYLK